MDRNPPASSVHGFFQARVLEWGAIAFSDTLSTSREMTGWMLQAGINIGGRNINNLRYTDEPTLMAESEEKLKEPLEAEGGE